MRYLTGFVFVVFVYGSAILTLAACGEEGGRCVLGAENCGCLEDGACNDGLSCSADNICVAAGTDDGPTTDSVADDTFDSDSVTEAEAPCVFSCSSVCVSAGGTPVSGICADSAQTCCDMTGVDTGPVEPLDCEIPLRTPITRTIYTADPSAHVFGGNLFLYTSHDEDYANGSFIMRDYHVFSLGEDCQFVDEGVILGVDDVAWAKSDMWAPDAAYKNGTYYLYFPAKDSSGRFHIGVATAASPTGPFTAEPSYIEGSISIDPAVFVDDDGQAYLYFGGLWGGQLECYKSGTYQSYCTEPTSGPALGPKVAKLDATMKQFSGAVEEVSIRDASGTAIQASDHNRRFFEGPWVHKKDGTYYLSYSTGDTQLLVYATADNPMGPFTYKGILLPYHGSGWTTHDSVAEFQGEWYLFYHDSTCSNGNTNRRCVKVADLHYNADGTIQTVSLR